MTEALTMVQPVAGMPSNSTTGSARKFAPHSRKAWPSGPLAATVAYQQVRNGALGVPPGWNRQRTLLLGASYDLVRAKLFGQAGLVRTDATTDTETRLYSFGIALPVGAGQLLAQYGNAEADFGGAASRTTNRSLSVGYDYFFSKRTDIYAVYMNDRTTGLAAGNTLAGGLRLRF